MEHDKLTGHLLLLYVYKIVKPGTIAGFFILKNQYLHQIRKAGFIHPQAPHYEKIEDHKQVIGIYNENRKG